MALISRLTMQQEEKTGKEQIGEVPEETHLGLFQEVTDIFLSSLLCHG